MSYVILALWLVAIAGSAFYFVPDINHFAQKGDKYAAEVGILAFAAVSILMTGLAGAAYMINEQRSYHEVQERTNVLTQSHTGRGE